MPSYSTPARVRFPRFDLSGGTPTDLAPGSLAVNWADRKIYVGDAAGHPMRFTQWVDDWNVTLEYRAGDFVVFNNNLYRAQQDLPPNSPSPIPGGSVNWQNVTGADRAVLSEPFATTALTGGTITTVPGVPYALAVDAGTGVIVQGINGIGGINRFSWGATQITLPSNAPGWHTVCVSASAPGLGVVMAFPLDLPTLVGRDMALLASVLVGAGGIEVVSMNKTLGGDLAASFIEDYASQGGAFRLDGLTCSVGAGLAVNVAAGRVFGLYWPYNTTGYSIAHTVDVAATAGAPLQYARRDRLIGGVVTALNTAQWDNGTALAAVPAASATIQYVFMARQGPLYVQYGSTLYGGVAAAFAGLASDWAATKKFMASTSTVLLCALIMRGDAALPGNVTVVTAANRGDPFLHVTAGEGSQYLLLDGSRAMGGALDMGGNAIDDAVIDGGVF